MTGRLLVTGGSGFIGNAVVAAALGRGYDVLSLDLAPPKVPEHSALWQRVDILDKAALGRSFDEFRPTAVVHLAARADTDSEDLRDYDINVTGTRLVLDTARSTSSVTRLVHTSTQYVFTLGSNPVDDEDFAPFTAYGESKVQSEKVVRSESGDLCWTIIRPTNIWGPWHPRYPQEFWRVLARGLYVHPSGRPVRRAYGYVGNVADQILTILACDRSAVDGRVLYVGDDAILLDDWVDAFSFALKGRRARRVPLGVLQVLARTGDAAKRLHLKAPLTSSRLRNMIEEHVAPMAPTFQILGPAPISMATGVAETVTWLRSRETA